MKNRFRLYRRAKTGVFYLHDGDTGKQESLGTRDRAEAKTLLATRNESVRQPQLNLQIARAYLAASDPASTKRTWQVPLEELAKTKSGTTRDRWISVLKDPAFEVIRNLPLLETRAEHLLKVMETGIGLDQRLPPSRPQLRLGHGMAALAPHSQKALAQDPVPRQAGDHRRRASGHPQPSAQSHLARLLPTLLAFGGVPAFLAAEDVDWEARVVSFARRKTRTVSMIHFGPEVEAVLRTLPATGPFFPKLRTMNSGHRATEFTRICRRVGVKGVTLHSYRYAWAGRAKQCGYPERFAQEALGHNSKAAHRSYSRKAKVKLPSLESFEKQAAESKVIAFPPPQPSEPGPQAQIALSPS